MKGDYGTRSERHRGCQSVHERAVRGHSGHTHSGHREGRQAQGAVRYLGWLQYKDEKDDVAKKSLTPDCEGPGRVCKEIWT